MKTYKLRNVDPDDISLWIAEIEATFDVHFDNDAFADVSTFGQLCDRVKSLLTLPHGEHCTYQKAFYQLKKALGLAIGVQKIAPNTSLAELLPEESRISQVKQIEEHLGIKLNIFRPPMPVTVSLLLTTLASFVGLFYNWPVALPILLISLVNFRISSAYANSLTVTTVGELTRLVVWENYMRWRPEAATINYAELESFLRDWASYTFSLDKTELHREATFV